MNHDKQWQTCFYFDVILRSLEQIIQVVGGEEQSRLTWQELRWPNGLGYFDIFWHNVWVLFLTPLVFCCLVLFDCFWSSSDEFVGRRSTISIGRGFMRPWTSTRVSSRWSVSLRFCIKGVGWPKKVYLPMPCHMCHTKIRSWRCFCKKLWEVRLELWSSPLWPWIHHTQRSLYKPCALLRPVLKCRNGEKLTRQHQLHLPWTRSSKRSRRCKQILPRRSDGKLDFYDVRIETPWQVLLVKEWWWNVPKSYQPASWLELRLEREQLEALLERQAELKGLCSMVDFGKDYRSMRLQDTKGATDGGRGEDFRAGHFSARTKAKDFEDEAVLADALRFLFRSCKDAERVFGELKARTRLQRNEIPEGYHKAARAMREHWEDQVEKGQEHRSFGKAMLDRCTAWRGAFKQDTSSRDAALSKLVQECGLAWDIIWHDWSALLIMRQLRTQSTKQSMCSLDLLILQGFPGECRSHPKSSEVIKPSSIFYKARCSRCSLGHTSAGFQPWCHRLFIACRTALAKNYGMRLPKMKVSFATLRRKVKIPLQSFPIFSGWHWVFKLLRHGSVMSTVCEALSELVQQVLESIKVPLGCCRWP